MNSENPVPNPPEPGQLGLSDPERWLEEYGDYLFQFALARLRDPSLAEDAVQETFLAALRGGARFAGRSAEKGWLVGILKNKVYDHYRKVSRETSFTDLQFYAEEENEGFVSKGLGMGGWSQEVSPQDWEKTGESLDNELFWRTYRECASKLPKNVAAAFNLREVDDVDSREICALLNITEGNLWVMLHRARMALRRCLEVNWFGRMTSK